MSSSNALAEGSSRRFRGLLVPAALGGLLVVYFAVALVAFLARTGTPELLAGLSTPGARSAIRNSLLTAPVSTAIATVLGVPLAYVLARRSFPGKRVLEALILLPLVVPPVVGGAMVLTAVGRFTPIGAAAAAVGIPLTGSLVGVVLAQTFVAAPFVVITARAGFGGVDERLERASRSLGYGPLATFRNVSLPLARGAIVAGVVLTFARAIGEFGATMMVAYNPRTMPTRIWVEFIAGGIDATVPLALALLSIAVVVLVALTRLAGVPTVIER
jgi:molybdate/tungstate transport system permease protein